MNELRDGDQNTGYLHHKAESHRRRNTIKGLEDEGGVWHSAEEETERMVIKYFDELFSTTNPDENDMEQALEGLIRRVSNEMNMVVNVGPTTEEVFGERCIQQKPLALMVCMLFFISSAGK